MDAKGVTLKYTYGDVGQASRLECICERDVASSLDDTAGRLVKEGNKTYRYGYLDKVLSVIDGETTRTYTYHADGQLASATVGGGHRTPRTPSETETFLWDGLALIQRGDAQFVNEPHVGGGNPVASSKGTSYFNDALGTTVGSKQGGKYSAAALTAFGEDLTVHSPTPTSLPASPTSKAWAMPSSCVIIAPASPSGRPPIPSGIPMAGISWHTAEMES